MHIKVLGPGCPRCRKVEETVSEVIKELGVEASVEKVKDMKAIMEYPIVTTPGLVINEELVCFGRIPSKAEITTWITAALAK